MFAGTFLKHSSNLKLRASLSIYVEITSAVLFLSRKRTPHEFWMALLIEVIVKAQQRTFCGKDWAVRIPGMPENYCWTLKQLIITLTRSALCLAWFLTCMSLWRRFLARQKRNQSSSVAGQWLHFSVARLQHTDEREMQFNFWNFSHKVQHLILKK